MTGAGHQFFTPTYTGLGERAHLANPSNDLETHIDDVLAVLKFEDLRNVALGAHNATDLFGCVRTCERTSLIDLVPPPERQRLLDSVKTGDGWRVTPNPFPPDTSDDDVVWISKYRMPQSVKCFEQPLRLQADLSLRRAYIHCVKYADQKPFGQFASRAGGNTGWQTYDLDASHSPNVTAPQALMDVL
jgi:hypothetical protein